MAIILDSNQFKALLFNLCDAELITDFLHQLGHSSSLHILPPGPVKITDTCLDDNQKTMIFSLIHLENIMQVIVLTSIIINNKLQHKYMVLDIEMAKRIIVSLLHLENMMQVIVLT